MRSYDGTPMICAGSMIHGPSQYGVMVDQTPVQVVAALEGAEGLIEFSRDGVAVYIAAAAPITAITPTYEKVGAADA